MLARIQYHTNSRVRTDWECRWEMGRLQHRLRVSLGWTSTGRPQESLQGGTAVHHTEWMSEKGHGRCTTQCEYVRKEGGVIPGMFREQQEGGIEWSKRSLYIGQCKHLGFTA